MSPIEPLVSIALPVRNGERHLGNAVRSVLDQDYEHLELVISDNASDDGTEEICRGFARSDARVRYHRQPHDIGLVPNFNAALHLARGHYFRWIGDDDWLTSTYVRRCVEVLDKDASLVLVTTQQAYVRPDGAVESAAYDATTMRSARPVERFAEMLRLQTESHLLLDPLYGMMRRDLVIGVPRPVMLHEDEVFAARLALAGPFGHLGQVLSYRRLKPFVRLPATARRLGVAPWRGYVATSLQCRELLVAVCEADLSPRERRQAREAVARMFVRRKRVTAAHRARRLAALVAPSTARSRGLARSSAEGQ